MHGKSVPEATTRKNIGRVDSRNTFGFGVIDFTFPCRGFSAVRAVGVYPRRVIDPISSDKVCCQSIDSQPICQKPLFETDLAPLPG
jgi:hypothetical protein